ncbi:hypothetical protein BD311DRAFT_678802 [Dichomitus squalens]|uniref:Uncharacterized protein n=1 Tax=Dichomitus squalens TaxID=114155 RepID=A0A4Q9M6L9_9APHY|nr:hypothetical protein BD311DRAFT_678802 [Dichomitus squalens]
MMADLERLFAAKDIAFSRDGNRLRCFPHVVNISVKHGLTALTDVSLSTDSTPSNDALRKDPIKRARQLVSACRASSLRREMFSAAIKEVNESGRLPETLPPNAQLLRDVETRWSSTFLMIDRLLELYPAVTVFMEKEEQKDIAHYLLDKHELEVLSDIRSFLRIPHQVQQILSASHTATAPLVIPAYEDLLDLLKLARGHYPRIAHAISASASILESYMGYTRHTRVYALAMGMWNHSCLVQNHNCVVAFDC